MTRHSTVVFLVLRPRRVAGLRDCLVGQMSVRTRVQFRIGVDGVRDPHFVPRRSISSSPAVLHMLADTVGFRACIGSRKGVAR